MKEKTKNINRRLGIGALILTASIALGEKAKANIYYYPDKPSNNIIKVDKEGKITGISTVKDNETKKIVPATGNEDFSKRTDSDEDYEDTLYGSYFEDNSEQSTDNNRIEINGLPTLENNVKLYEGSSSAKDNTVIINNVKVINGRIFSQSKGDVIRNKILISNVEKITENIDGGNAYHNATKCNENLIKIAGADTGVEIIWDINGANAHCDEVNKNKVVIENLKSFKWSIVGGNNKGLGKTDGNEVKLVGISSGAFGEGNIYGGNSYSNHKLGTSANDNIVSLENILMGENTGIIGGHGFETKRNVINIAGASDLSNSHLAGGVQLIDEENNLYRASNSFDNTLNIGRTHDGQAKAWISPKGVNSVRSIEGIQKIDFYGVNWDSKKPAFRIIESSYLDNTKFETKNISFKDTKELQAAIKNGGKMSLIDVAQYMGIKSENILTPNGTYKVGTGLEGKGKTSVEDNDLVYTLVTSQNGNLPTPKPGTPTPNENNGEVTPDGKPILTARPQTHNVAIGSISGLAALNAGQNYIEKGVATNLDNGTYGLTVSVGTHGGSEEHETGSSIKTNTWNANFGVGNTVQMSNGDLAYMAFYEHGTGDYKVKSEVGKGKGDISYQGLALATKYRFNNDFYAGAALRIGRVKNEAKDVLAGVDGETYSYDTKSLYTGASILFGKVTKVSDSSSSDIYGKYSYMGIAKDDFKIEDEEYKMDAVNSSILTLGAKINHEYNAWNFYYGLAVEQELGGEAKGTVNDREIRSAKINGTSFVGEIGAKLKVSNDSPWSLDLGVQGSAGKHKEVRGNLGVTYSF